MIKWCKVVEALDTQFLITKAEPDEGPSVLVEFMINGDMYECRYHEHPSKQARDTFFDAFGEEQCKDLYISMQANMN